MLATYAYPLFFLLFLLLTVKLIHDETGWDTYDPRSYIEAQRKLHNRWKFRYKIRKMRQWAEKQVEEYEKNRKEKKK